MAIFDLPTWVINGISNVYSAFFIPSVNGIIFKKQALTTSYVCDPDGNSNESAGQINCGLFKNKSFQINFSLSGVTQINLRIRGKANSLMPWATHITKAYTASSDTEDWIELSENPTLIRAEISYTGGTPGANDWITVGFNFSR